VSLYVFRYASSSWFLEDQEVLFLPLVLVNLFSVGPGPGFTTQAHEWAGIQTELRYRSVTFSLEGMSGPVKLAVDDCTW
jgi:hypothetical protein